jgi:hypothetical protein
MMARLARRPGNDLGVRLTGGRRMATRHMLAIGVALTTACHHSRVTIHPLPAGLSLSQAAIARALAVRGIRSSGNEVVVVQGVPARDLPPGFVAIPWRPAGLQYRDTALVMIRDFRISADSLEASMTISYWCGPRCGWIGDLLLRRHDSAADWDPASWTLNEIF